ncbi:MAG: hypothetical protein IJY62_02150 [Clostridia bacterium]|nr:hypothetical protein [Clostridia bacterium]
MKQQNEQQTEFFPFRFTKTLIALSIAALCLCVIGGVVSVFGIIREGIHGLYDALQYPLLILICIFGIVVIVSLLIRSRYVVKEKTLITQFGVVKSKIETKDITAIVLDTETKKIAVYVGETYSVVSMPEKYNETFARALLKSNPKIDYSFTITENKPPETEKKD